jgi:hypothetical protein
MTLKQFKQVSNVNGIWQFLVWFLRTKEGHYVLIALFILLILFMFLNPEAIIKLRILLWNFLLKKVQ